MLKQQIEQEIKKALKAGESLKLSTLRMLLAAIQNEEIAKQKQLTDEDILPVVQRQIKQHRESIEAFTKGNRIELAQKEKDELEILNKFLPQQMNEEEIKKTVAEVLAGLPESDKSNFGKVMGAIMAKIKGKTDGGLVGRLVKDQIG